MRKDMSKVLTERPRQNRYSKISRWHSNKTGLRLRSFDPDLEYEDQPKRLPVSRRRQYGHQCKEFTDLLGPLKGFLRSSVGKPWDKVYSELCEYLDRRKTTGRHVFQHLEDYVETNCFFGKEGRIYACTPSDGIQPVDEVVESTRQYKILTFVVRHKPKDYYVHPATGLLCRTKLISSVTKREEERKQQIKTYERKPISFNQSYVRLNGVWYIGDYVPDEGKRPYDLANLPSEIERRKLEELGTRYWDGKRWMQLVSKRKCSQQELQKAGLKNALRS